MENQSINSINEPKLETDKHVNYFDKSLFMLPHPYTSSDSNSLELLGKLDEVVNDEKRKQFIDWIYAQQVTPSQNLEGELNYQFCGFRGSPLSGARFSTEHNEGYSPYDRANIAMTYTALLSLILLKDDFSRVNKKAILKALSFLQQENGSFVPVVGSHEADLRFTYCAFAISYMLDDWTSFEVNKSVQFILASQTYENAISQGPDLESHGGSTYCGIASLHLFDKLDLLRDREGTLEWCLNRQHSGFQGRMNKPDDTCYSFWIGGSIEILGGAEYINVKSNKNFLLSTQTKMGGFSKYPGGYPDILHAYTGLAGLSLIKCDGLKKLSPALNLSEDGVNYWSTQIKPKLH